MIVKYKIVCRECEGTGKRLVTTTHRIYTSACQHCNGEGVREERLILQLTREA